MNTPLEKPKGNRDPSKEMPKWLIYGFLLKAAVVTCIVLAVLWFSGMFG
ncbi:MAG: hypothetical protein WBD01_09295 [Salaquimonas sp.]